MYFPLLIKFLSVKEWSFLSCSRVMRIRSFVVRVGITFMKEADAS